MRKRILPTLIVAALSLSACTQFKPPHYAVAPVETASVATTCFEATSQSDGAVFVSNSAACPAGIVVRIVDDPTASHAYKVGVFVQAGNANANQAVVVTPKPGSTIQARSALDNAWYRLVSASANHWVPIR